MTLCGHVNPDFTMCNRKLLYYNSTRCKKHFKDIEGSSKTGQRQMKLLLQIRGINTRLSLSSIPLLPVSVEQMTKCEKMIRTKRK